MVNGRFATVILFMSSLYHLVFEQFAMEAMAYLQIIYDDLLLNKLEHGLFNLIYR